MSLHRGRFNATTACSCWGSMPTVGDSSKQIEHLLDIDELIRLMYIRSYGLLKHEHAYV